MAKRYKFHQAVALGKKDFGRGDYEEADLGDEILRSSFFAKLTKAGMITEILPPSTQSPPLDPRVHEALERSKARAAAAQKQVDPPAGSDSGASAGETSPPKSNGEPTSSGAAPDASASPAAPAASVVLPTLEDPPVDGELPSDDLSPEDRKLMQELEAQEAAEKLKAAEAAKPKGKEADKAKSSKR